MTKRDLTVKNLVNYCEKGWREFYSNKEATFSSFHQGPSLHFHVRTITKVRELLEKKSRYRGICNDTEYVELLYATLTAWGMDRKGRGPKLQDFEIFKQSLQDPSFIKCLDRLKGNTLHELNDISTIQEQVEQAYDWLREQNRILKVRKALVGIAKTLHHLLPDLLIPIDRRYIISLLNRLKEEEYRPTQQGDSFEDYWKCIRVSHFLCKKKGLSPVSPTPKYPMNTSIPKLIDNSLIGMSVIFQNDHRT